jgi:hypothetical protein
VGYTLHGSCAEFRRSVVVKMSMLVAQMMKMKATNLSGIEKHNKRIFDNRGNPDIDPSQKDLNYDLMNREGRCREIVKEIIDSQREGNRAIRKDAVLVNEWIISSDRAFFKEMPGEERDRFFQEATDWFKERYGQQNIAYAQVHLDETTPHMHVGVVPMRDGKLQAKNIFNRQELRDIQEELPKFLKEKGFEIERGKENSERKHLTVPEYKEAKEAAKELALEVQKSQQKLFNNLSDIKALEKQEKGLKSKIELNKAYIQEYQERTSELVESVKQSTVKPMMEAPVIQPIFEPEVNLDLLNRYVKIKRQDYDQMVKSQETAAKQHGTLVKTFNDLAQLTKETQQVNVRLAEELERAKKAIPIQTEHFVSRTDYNQVVQAYQESERKNEEKDKIIEEQKQTIRDLKDFIISIRTQCIDFIIEKRSQAFNLVNELAKKLDIVSLVNEKIHELRKQKEQRSLSESPRSKPKSQNRDNDF